MTDKAKLLEARNIALEAEAVMTNPPIPPNEAVARAIVRARCYLGTPEVIDSLVEHGWPEALAEADAAIAAMPDMKALVGLLGRAEHELAAIGRATHADQICGPSIRGAERLAGEIRATLANLSKPENE
jgi:hypothetical protein